MPEREGPPGRAEAEGLGALSPPRHRVASSGWRDWPEWMIGSVGLALFAVPVQAILAVVRGWSVPSHLWSAGAAFAITMMAGHALVHAAIGACRRDAIAALRCAGVAAGLAACLAAVVLLAGAVPNASGAGLDDPADGAAGAVR